VDKGNESEAPATLNLAFQPSSLSQDTLQYLFMDEEIKLEADEPSPKEQLVKHPEELDVLEFFPFQ
jgi:hypothetical protein